MKEIDKKILTHCKNSKRLRELYLTDKKMSYKKNMELKILQTQEYEKMMFFKNLKREMVKNNERD